MDHTVLDVAVIGAGHAGLGISACLKQHALNHIVFERGRVGETWRTQRWNSFVMNTANKTNLLPGQTYSGNAPDAFCTAREFAASLAEYAAENRLPVLENTKVISVEKPEGDRFFSITVSENGTEKKYLSKQVVVASGCQNEKKIPDFAQNISSGILQLHTGEYRHAQQLPEGAALVVGSAQSGTQIAEDLILAGKKVYLATSMVARVPRRYRGKDIVDWLLMLGFFDLKTEDVTDPKVFAAKVPLLSGVGELGHTLSLQSLAKMGVTILGKMTDADPHNAFLSPGAQEHVKFGDGFSQKAKAMVDEFIEKKQITAPSPEVEIADMPDLTASCASSATSLNFKEHNITSIIWTTGFNGDFSYLKFPVFDSNGSPVHKNGLSEIKGLYFLGLPWLRKRGSGMVLGINDDAPFITQEILTAQHGK